MRNDMPLACFIHFRKFRWPYGIADPCVRLPTWGFLLVFYRTVVLNVPALTVAWAHDGQTDGWKIRPRKTKSEKLECIVTIYLLTEFTEFWHSVRGPQGLQNAKIFWRANSRNSLKLIFKFLNFDRKFFKKSVPYFFWDFELYWPNGGWRKWIRTENRNQK